MVAPRAAFMAVDQIAAQWNGRSRTDTLAPMRVLLAVFALSACKFDPPSGGPPSDAATDAPIASIVQFVSVTSSAAMLRPGHYGIEVEAVLRNGLTEAITNVRPTLSFQQGAMDRGAMFRWREADRRDPGLLSLNPTIVEAGADATFRFRVDALAHAALDAPIQIDGVADFDAAGGTHAAAPLAAPFTVPFETLRAPIVVNTATDEVNGSSDTSFRDALVRANATAGLDRIVFDPAVFPPDAPRDYVLDPTLNEMPPINGDLVIDGSGAGFVIVAPATAGESGFTTLRLVNGTMVVSGIGFRDLAFQYPSGPGCGGPAEAQRGGAIWAQGGTVIVDGNRFSDPTVPERGCHGASVRIDGGSGHRVLNNHWTDQTMDAVLVKAPTIEVSGNVMNSGIAGGIGRTDDGIVVEALGNRDLWVIGNLFVDHQFSGILAAGPNDGVLHVVNNTFVRNREHAVRRTGMGPQQRRVVMVNNAHFDNAPETVFGQGNASGLEISYDLRSTSNMLCVMCPNATVDTATVQAADLRFMNAAGITLEDFNATAGSPLIDSGRDLLDRNGSTPGRFHGSGPDRGAVE